MPWTHAVVVRDDMLLVQHPGHCRALRQTHKFSHGTVFQSGRCREMGRRAKVGSTLSLWDGQSPSSDAVDNETHSQSPVQQPDAAVDATSSCLWKVYRTFGNSIQAWSKL